MTASALTPQKESDFATSNKARSIVLRPFRLDNSLAAAIRSNIWLPSFNCRIHSFIDLLKGKNHWASFDDPFPNDWQETP